MDILIFLFVCLSSINCIDPHCAPKANFLPLAQASSWMQAPAFCTCMASDSSEHHFKSIQALSFEFQKVRGTAYLKLGCSFHYHRAGNIFWNRH